MGHVTMTLDTIAAALVTVVTAMTSPACTFCVVHEVSRFESDCRARGGEVRTLETMQLCVPSGSAGTGARVVNPDRADDDAGAVPSRP